MTSANPLESKLEQYATLAAEAGEKYKIPELKEKAKAFADNYKSLPTAYQKDICDILTAQITKKEGKHVDIDEKVTDKIIQFNDETQKVISKFIELAVAYHKGIRAMQEKIDATSEELNKYKAEGTIEDLINAKNAAQRCENEHKDYKEKIKELKELKSDYEELKIAYELIKDDSNKLEELQEKYEQLEKEKKDFQDKYNASEIEKKDFQDKYNASEIEKKDFKDKYTQAEIDKTDLEKQKKEFEEKANNYDDLLDKLNRALMAAKEYKPTYTELEKIDLEDL